MRKMACTTILVGKKASYDGSTMIARNDDSGSGHFTAKKFTVVTPKEQPKTYVSVLSHVKVELPEQAMRYTSMPNAEKGEGIWAASGVNEANVAMTKSWMRSRPPVSQTRPRRRCRIQNCRWMRKATRWNEHRNGPQKPGTAGNAFGSCCKAKGQNA